MSEPVLLDASAVLAVLFEEPGAEIVESVMSQAEILSVNLTEVMSKLVDKGFQPGEAEAAMGALFVPVRPFGAQAAIVAGNLRAITRSFGLSLGDRACIADALVRGVRLLTADRVWAELDLGIKIEVIR